MGCSTTCKLGTATTVGVALSTIGAIFTVYWPVIFEKVLNDQLVLSESSKSFELWEVTPIPMYIEFYFFNWTNPEDIYNHSTKPILTEIGPYVFREERRKVIEAWNDNSTVTFLQNRTWYFEPSMSNGSLDDVVQTVNIPAITAAYAIRKDSRFIKAMLNIAINSFFTQIHVSRKVREFIFEGYSDPLLDLAKLIPAGIAPISIPFDKFGWFYTRNGSATYDGLFNMYTGKSDMNKFGSMGEWNYENSTTFYKSYCGNVNGSAGEFFPPERKKTKISLFSSDVCRTLDLNYKEEIEVDGINGFRFWGDDKMLQNDTACPDNWCFCPSGECAPNGAIDVSTCKWGAPAYISFPHFYHADPYYRKAVIGMNPSENRHQMYIDIEPRSGIPLQVAASLQINILMQPMPEYKILKQLPKIYFPTIWFKQTARIDDKLGPQVKLLSLIPMIGAISFYAILSAGISILFIVGICYVTMRCRKDEETVILRKSVLNIGTLKKRLLVILRCCSAASHRNVRVQPTSSVPIHKWPVTNTATTGPFLKPYDEASTVTGLDGPGVDLVSTISSTRIRRFSQIPNPLHHNNEDEEKSPLYTDPNY